MEQYSVVTVIRRRRSLLTLGTFVLSSLAVAAAILATGDTFQYKLWLAFGISVGVAPVFWFALRLGYLRITVLDQAVWVLLLSHTVFVARARQGSLPYEQTLSPEILIQVAVWGICLLYAMIRLAQQPTRLAQCLSPTLRYCSLFVGLALLSVTYSADPLLSVFWGFKLVVFLAVLIAFFDATDPVQSVNRFWNATHCALVLMLVQFAVFALISPDSAFDTEDASGLVRLGGYLFPPTQFSAACGMVLTLSLIAFIAGRHRVLHIALCLISGLLMLASAGRGGMLATVVSTTMVCLWYRRYRLAFTGITGSVIVFAAAPNIMAAFADVVTRRQDWDQISTLTGRLYIWEYAISLVKERPLFGWGYVSGGKVALVLPTGWWRTPGDAHNALLEVLLALGLAGLLVLGVIIIRTITSLVTIYARQSAGLTDTAYIASASIFMSVLVQGLFEAAYGGVPRLATGIFLGSVVCLQALRALPPQPYHTYLSTRCGQ
jgi:hypothetical protein